MLLIMLLFDSYGHAGLICFTNILFMSAIPPIMSMRQNSNHKAIIILRKRKSTFRGLTYLAKEPNVK